MRVEATGQKSRTTYKYFPRGWTVRGSVEFLLNGDTQRRGVRYTMTTTTQMGYVLDSLGLLSIAHALDPGVRLGDSRRALAIRGYSCAFQDRRGV
jgi:hypothetical protein